MSEEHMPHEDSNPVAATAITHDKPSIVEIALDNLFRIKRLIVQSDRHFRKMKEKSGNV